MSMKLAAILGIAVLTVQLITSLSLFDIQSTAEIYVACDVPVAVNSTY